jgi:hypothetical protein
MTLMHARVNFHLKVGHFDLCAQRANSTPAVIGRGKGIEVPRWVTCRISPLTVDWPVQLDYRQVPDFSRGRSLAVSTRARHVIPISPN